MVIKINIVNKRASVEGAPIIICGNSGYQIQFAFDAEWDHAGVKTARFVYVQAGAVKYQDVIFTGDTVTAPVLSSIREVMVGVYAGDLQTTTPARIPCDFSILCNSGAEDLPVQEAKTLQDQIGDLVDLKTPDNTCLVAAINWVFENGGSGADAPQEAVLYSKQSLTEEQKAQARANIGAISKDDIPTGGGSGDFQIDETLILKDGILGVNTTNDMEQDNTLPITSAGVFATVGNIEALLKTI